MLGRPCHSFPSSMPQRQPTLTAAQVDLQAPPCSEPPNSGRRKKLSFVRSRGMHPPRSRRLRCKPEQVLVPGEAAARQLAPSSASASAPIESAITFVDRHFSASTSQTPPAFGTRQARGHIAGPPGPAPSRRPSPWNALSLPVDPGISGPRPPGPVARPPPTGGGQPQGDPCSWQTRPCPPGPLPSRPFLQLNQAPQGRNLSSRRAPELKLAVPLPSAASTSRSLPVEEDLELEAVAVDVERIAGEHPINLDMATPYPMDHRFCETPGRRSYWARILLTGFVPPSSSAVP